VPGAEWLSPLAVGQILSGAKGSYRLIQGLAEHPTALAPVVFKAEILTGGGLLRAGSRFVMTTSCETKPCMSYVLTVSLHVRQCGRQDFASNPTTRPETRVRCVYQSSHRGVALHSEPMGHSR